MKKLVLTLAILLTFPLSATAGEITVAAGAGLKDVLSDLSAAFAQRNPSVKIIKNSVVSGVLAKQLDSGAQMDIVFTANRGWMDYLNEKKHVDPGTITPFAYDTLVFVGKGRPQASGLNELAKLEEDSGRQSEERARRGICHGGPQECRG